MISKTRYTPTGKKRSRQHSIAPCEDIVQIQDDAYDQWCERQANDPLGRMGDDDVIVDTPECEHCDDNGCDMCPGKYDVSS